MERKAALECANGDWNSRKVQLWVPWGVTIHEPTFVQTCAENVAYGLSGTVWKVYQRKNWTGADESVDAIALIESCHYLGSQTVQLLYCRITGKLSKSKGSRYWKWGTF